MSPFLSAVFEFVNAVRDQQAWIEELNDHSQKIAELLDRATPSDIEEALRRLAALFPRVPPVATGLVALNCGSLVERGGNPGIAGPPLLDLLPRLLVAVTDFYNRCRARMEADPEVTAAIQARAQANGEEYDLNAYIADETWDALAQRYGPAIFEEAPIPVLAHMSEQVYCLGVIAHLSKSKKLRLEARSRPELFQRSLETDDARGHGSFLTDMLRVMDNKRVLVLHPGEQKGFEITISGIADNFQLQTLLAGTLIGDPDEGWLTGEKPEPEVVALARDAEFTEPLTTTGSFNLWNWTGLQPDGTLPDAEAGGHEFWIWNEGTPGDILKFEDVRVVLLGPPSIERHWNAGRRFPNMRGELIVERALTPEEVGDWLARIATAPRPEQRR